jgi:multiple sugar transport system permease protein
MSVTLTPNIPRKRGGLHAEERRQGWLFALPHLVLFTVFLLIPVVYGFYISLHRWHILGKTHPFIGGANYASALHDDIFYLALTNTLYFVLLVVPVGNAVSLSLALGLSSVRRGGTFYKVAFYLPVVISIAVVAVLWRWLYNTQVGLLNLYLKGVTDFLRSIGLSFLPPFTPIPWLANPKMVMPSIALLSVWWGAGGNMITYLAGLAAIPDDYYEAARIDGANAGQQFRHITLPLLRPTLLFCLVMSVLASFQIFGQSYVLFAPGSGPARSGLTLALYMYQQGFSQYEIGYGASIAYLLFGMVLLLTIAQFRLFRGEEGRR